MRIESKIALSLVSLSAIGTSFIVGHREAEALGNQELSLESSMTSVQEPQEDPAVSPEPTQEPSAEPSETSSAKAEVAVEPTPTLTEAPVTQATDGSYTSEVVNYKFGEMQLEIVVSEGLLAEINLLKATTEGRGYDQAPPILVEAALQAGTADFGNLTGATFTTDAFKKALQDAMHKAGF